MMVSTLRANSLGPELPAPPPCPRVAGERNPNEESRSEQPCAPGKPLPASVAPSLFALRFHDSHAH